MTGPRGEAATIGVMRRPVLHAAVLVGITVLMFGASRIAAQAAGQKESAPDVPDAIQVPAGEDVVLFVRGTGSQVYTCKAGAGDRFSWTLKEPEAELRDRNDKVIGQHSAGPKWTLKDGSEVTGTAAAKVESLDADSIPWLLVKVTSNSGKGSLAKVTSIQRVHTKGGKAPTEGCDATHHDAETKVAYSADYYFFAPSK